MLVFSLHALAWARVEQHLLDLQQESWAVCRWLTTLWACLPARSARNWGRIDKLPKSFSYNHYCQLGPSKIYRNCQKFGTVLLERADMRSNSRVASQSGSSSRVLWGIWRCRGWFLESLVSMAVKFRWFAAMMILVEETRWKCTFYPWSGATKVCHFDERLLKNNMDGGARRCNFCTTWGQILLRRDHVKISSLEYLARTRKRWDQEESAFSNPRTDDIIGILRFIRTWLTLNFETLHLPKKIPHELFHILLENCCIILPSPSLSLSSFKYFDTFNKPSWFPELWIETQKEKSLWILHRSKPQHSIRAYPTLRCTRRAMHSRMMWVVSPVTRAEPISNFSEVLLCKQ